MKTPVDLEIRRRVAAVQNGEMRIRDFFHWYIPMWWEADFTDNPGLDAMTRRITYAWCEATSGILTRDELLRELAEAVSAKPSAARHEVA